MSQSDEIKEIKLAPKTMMLVAGVLWVLALLFVTIGGSWYLDVRSFAMNATRTEGIVVEMESYISAGTEAPVIKFTPEGAETPITFESELAEFPPAYRKGERVQVLYDPDDPGDAETERALGLPLGAIVVAGFGIVFGIFGLVFFRNRNMYAEEFGGTFL